MQVTEVNGLDALERMELERLRQAIAHAPDGFVGIDEAGVITTWNAAATRLLGWESADILGRTLHETLIPAEMRAAHLAGMHRYLDGGGPVVAGRPIDLPVVHRDGHRVAVEITIWPSGNPGDRHFHAFLRDTTPRQAAAERAARQTRALLAAVETQRAVTSVAQDREQVLRVVTERAVAAFPSASGAMVELIEDDLLRYVAGSGTLAEHVGKHQTIADSVSGAALADGRPTHCTDVETDERASVGICRDTGVRSMCVTPLYHGERAIGVLKLASDRPDAFDADDAYHLELVAGTVGAALRHAGDYEASRAANVALQRQARLLELIPAAVIVRDPAGEILWWNTGAQRLYGWSADAALGRSTHRLFGTAIVGGATIVAEQTEALERDGHWDGELQHLTATGRTVTVLSCQVVHRPADGDDAQVLEINTDVSAARAAQQAVALNEQRFRAQFTQSAVGQVVRGLDGTLIAVNEAFAGMLGHRAEELTGHTIEELMHPDDVAAAHRHIARLFTGEAESYTHEVRLRQADGHWIDVEATISVVRGSDQRPRHLIVVATDISARRAAERARDQAAAALSERNLELEAADQLKLDMIGMLGHEIGNPLSSILGYSDLLVDAMNPEDPFARYVQMINRQAERLDEIVREVLAMVTLDAGNINAIRDTLSLRAEVERALDATDNRHLPVHGADADVLFHASHLQQVLVNLLSNATKYAGGASALHLERHGGRVRLRVEDTGPGVPAAFQPRLFDRMARADQTAETVRGTGLGLYIVRSLARANGGEVRYEPNPGGGSVFVVEADAGA
ncbi:PAS domain S-box protein [Actinoplanes sp. NPDC020271]|uniref:PAS domain S-box protein n=1 Tax=Actinoplanes sp. NPDC020271 TaxID=3363896 RepID=UPI003791A30F